MGLLDMLDWGWFDFVIGPIISFAIKAFLTILMLIFGFMGVSRVPKPIGKISVLLIIVIIIGLIWIFL